MIALLVTLLGLLTALAAGAMSQDEAAFLWEEANNRVAGSQTPEEFQAAAKTYRELAGGGVRNGHVFYNLGTAETLAHDYESAVQSLLRAERYMGSSPEIRQNLLLALEGGSKEAGETVNLPWYRPLLFWHFGLATQTRVTIALSAFAAFWVLMSLRVLGIRRGITQLTVIAGAVAIVFGSSAVTSLHQDAQSHLASELREQLMEGSP